MILRLKAYIVCHNSAEEQNDARITDDVEVKMKFPGIPENEEERLKSLYMIDLLDTRDDERFERLTRIGQRLFQVPIAVINLLDRDRQ